VIIITIDRDEIVTVEVESESADERERDHQLFVELKDAFVALDATIRSRASPRPPEPHDTPANGYG
jgi:hypothetical protein